jgi:hypothetical protein
MATRFEIILDAVHNFSLSLARMTKPRWHFNRDRLLTFFNIGGTLVTAVSTALPQVKGLSLATHIITLLQQTATALPQQQQLHAASVTEMPNATSVSPPVNTSPQA